MHLHGHHTRTFQRFVIAIGLAAVLMVMVTSNAWANQSAGWTPCECDENQYTLAVITFGGQGTISVSPQKDYYSKGELVIVTVTPGQDARFVKWQSVPPSHTAHESHYESVPLFITGNTQLTANLAPRHYTLTVNWLPAAGTVALPPGAQGGNGQFTVEAEYGESLTLTSTPYGGRHPKWRGKQTAGYRYGSSVTVKIAGDFGLQAEFADEAPNLNYGMSMNIAAGAAHISCAYDTISFYDPGSYDHAQAVGPLNRFAYTVNQTPGYSFNYITWFAGGANRYTTESAKSSRAGRDYSVHLSSNVNLIVETEGQGVVTSPHFKAGYNPRPYEQALYTQPAPTSLTPITNGNPVMMTPVPCPGWAFDHWEYKNANNEWVYVINPVPCWPSNITVYMNYWAGYGIHVPSGASSLSVRAVFYESTPHGTVSMPFRYSETSDGPSYYGVRGFSCPAIYHPAWPEDYCCEDHRDPDGSRYVHVHLPHGFPFYYANNNIVIPQQMSDWAWDKFFPNQTRQSNSTFSKNCFAYVCNAPTVMFWDAWNNNFTLPSSLADTTSAQRSYGDDDHVKAIDGVHNRGTEQNPDYVISMTSEKMASGGVYAGAWLPLGLPPDKPVRKLKD